MIEKYFFLKINSIINFFLIYTYQINGVVFLNLKNLLIICCSLLTAHCSLLRTRLVLSVLILFTLGLFSSLQAQQTYAQIANAGTPTAEQQTFANNSVASSYYSQAALVSIQPLLTRLGDSIITFSLPTSNTIYQAKKVNTASTSSPYYDEIWMGNLDDGHVGNVMFIRKDQLLSGFIHTEDSFFSIVPVADHTAFLLMHEVDYYDNFNCGNEQPTSVGEGNIIVGQCADSPNNCNVNVDVSVLMSDPAIAFLQNIPGASTNPFIPILYTLIGLESANFALINSDVDNFRFRFTIERFFFVFTPNNNLGIDLENFRDGGDAENRRDELGGDLAIMLTNQGYGTTFGIVSAIGPDDDNAYAIVEMPFLINLSQTGIAKAELRGEVLIRKDNFQAINDQRAAAGQSLFANPRNTATGGLRMKDPREVADRNLEAFIYTLGYAVDETGASKMEAISTHYESLDLLDKLGFKVPSDGSERKLCKNIAEVVDFCVQWENGREAYPYEVDGMVVKVDDRVLQERAGHTSHHPRWAIAYKFAAKQATTTLEAVEYQIGKIGSVTPVAKVAPVPLAGVTISSISLHNEDFITEKDLRLGDSVLIERAGDVIPYIVKALDDLRDGSETPIVFPQECPSCATPLLRAEGEAAWRCPNYECPAQVLQRIIFHVSKPAMDIDGLGRSIVERLMELGWVRSLPDIYRLDYTQIAQLEGFGDKSAANLKSAIDAARKNPIHRLLHSLSIHHLGKKVSKLLAGELKHVLELKDWTFEDYTNIKDVGPTVAENVTLYFADPHNVAMLEELERLGVNLTATEADRPVATVTEGPFVGKTILFTGKLLQMSRKEAQEKATAAGAKNISAVSGNLNILVVGEKAGSKLKKAQALGTVEIMTEEAFLALVNA